MLTRFVFGAAASAAIFTARAADGAPPSSVPSRLREPGVAVPDGARRADARRAAIALYTDGGDDFDGPGLRDALQSALGVAVSEGKNDTTEDLATVVVRRRARGDVTIVFVRPDGREVERTLELPRDRALATETIALAAGNLVRDEAAELVAALTPPPVPAAESPVAEAPPPDAVPSAPSPPATRRASCKDGQHVFFGADFAPYAGTSSVYPARRRTLSFNFIAGYALGLNGFELGVGANIESAFMCGAQIAAGANVVLGDVHGVQLATSNVALGDVDGAQLSVVNFAGGAVDGAQIGTVSVAGGHLDGAQIGVVNLLKGAANGNQTGVVNMAGGGADGAQIGVVNLTTGNVDGAQIGTTNIATGEVRGTQIGVFNYADVSDYPVGVVSVVRKGRTSVDGWVTESGIAMAGARHGGRVIHNVYGVGFRGPTPSGWSFALGLGARAELAPKLHVDFEAIAYWVQRREPFVEDAQIASLGASFGYALTPVFGLFAAPTFNTMFTPHPKLAEVGPPWGTALLHEGDTLTIRAWPGATLGIRASL
jgi:hypothetical protein